jgi:osmotically inducible lipoprotein OsmB
MIELQTAIRDPSHRLSGSSGNPFPSSPLTQKTASATLGAEIAEGSDMSETNHPPRKAPIPCWLLLSALTALGLAILPSCATPTRTGAAAGAGTGALLGGPPGALVGAGAGAVAGAVTEDRRRRR